MSIAPIDDCRKRAIDVSVTKTFQGDIARYSADEQSVGKQLARFFALRHSEDFRYIGRWLVWDSASECWRACRKEHVEAAEQICEEAAKIMLRWGAANSKAMAREVLRLAEFEPLMTKRIDMRLLDPLVLGGRQ